MVAAPIRKASPRAADEARRLIHACASASLATTGADGAPAASVVAVAAAPDGSPVLLLSDLAEHTKNLARDPRAALLYDGTRTFANPQEGPRVSLMGRIVPARDPRLAARYLARHPGAALYAGFADFGFRVMRVTRIRYVGGFARAASLKPAQVLAPKAAAAAVAAIEAEALAHMNADHAAAIARMGRNLLGKRGKHWRMIGIDPFGCDLRCGEGVHRLEFARPVASAPALRRTLADLAERARRGGIWAR